MKFDAVETLNKWLNAANRRKDSESAKAILHTLDIVEGITSCKKKEALEFLDSIKQTEEVLRIKEIVYNG